jgi:hypothetical protein
MEGIDAIVHFYCTKLRACPPLEGKMYVGDMYLFPTKKGRNAEVY